VKYLINRLTQNLVAGRDLRQPEERRRIAQIESWTSIAANIFIALIKAIFGLLTNSIALIADAVHSLSDVLSSAVIIIGFAIASRKPDHEHPHGHGRSEYMSGLIVAIMLIGAGVIFACSSYKRLTGGIYASPSIAAVAAVVGTILIKEFLYHFSIKLGHLIKSEALVGDAWHHRSDSLSSLLVLIALAGNILGIPSLDPYFGFIIAFFIIYTGFRIARNSTSLLLGSAPPEELQEEVVECARNISGVIDVHDLEIHDYGAKKVITLHIEVNQNMPLNEAHIIAHLVEDNINRRFHGETVVHIDPR
jgi:cation diffusion facilitator family transporter